MRRNNMGKHAIQYELNKILSLCLITISLTVSFLAFSNLVRDKRIRILEQQINELKFEQSYIEYVKEDGERQ
jgi:hypothetical protein